MSVKKLFYKNPYRTDFLATVLCCTGQGAHFAVELDATCFYPEGGGQPFDTGTLGGAKVLAVHEKGGAIIHITDIALPIGKLVEGKIDWARRFSLMQHHTAEHIVSGVVRRILGFDNVGFHMGDAGVTVDFSGELSPEQLLDIELFANRIVCSDIAVNAFYPDSATLAGLDYRSKKALSGEVRIVAIPNADCCACCGMHVAKTGEIGLIKLLSLQRYKGGSRVMLLCAERALFDYRQKDASVSDISRLLSVKPAEVSDAVRRVLGEHDALKAALAAAKEKLFSRHLEALDKGNGFIALFEEDLSPSELGRFCLRLSDFRPGPCLLLCGDDDSGYRYALSCASEDARALSSAMHKALGGRGGGSERLVQGSVLSSREQVLKYISR